MTAFQVTQKGLFASAVLLACAFVLILPASSQADPSTNVIHGTQVPEGTANYPYIVALVDAEGRQFCGGTLIAPYWVMTAAHCGSVDSIIYGRKQLSNVNQGERIAVAEQFGHTSFDTGSLSNDIKLLRIAHPPADLFTLPMASPSEDPPVGAEVWLAGWGLTEFSDSNTVDNLREAALDTFSNTACGLEWADFGVSIFSSQLCAAHWGASSADDRQACNGDSGGPLVYNGMGGARLVGLTSFGRPGCNGYPHPTVYTRVSSFNSWAHSFIDARAGFDAAQVAFGTASIGTAPVARTISVVSTGTAAVTVNSLSMTGSSDFAILSNGCTGATLVGSTKCPVTVQFTPTSQGVAAAQLNLKFVGGTSSISVSSYGVLGGGVPVVPPTLKLGQAGKAVSVKGKLRVVLKASYAIPANVNQTTACANVLRLTADIPGVRKSLKTQGAANWSLGKCIAKLTLKMPRKAKRKQVKFLLRFPGNTTLAATEQKFKIRIK